MHKAWSSKVIRQIPGLHGKKIDDFIPILSKIIRPVAAIISLRFALIFMACETPYRAASVDAQDHNMLDYLVSV